MYFFDRIINIVKDFVKRALFYIIILLVCGIGNVSCSTKEVKSETHRVQKELYTTPSNTNQYESPNIVSIRIKGSEPVLISGEEGILTIEVFLNNPENDTDQLYKWDIDAFSPVLWISSPAHCGIHFDKTEDIHRPDQQKRIIVPSPKTTTDPIICQVKYYVAPRSEAFHSYFWFDISTSLIAPGGKKIQDAGEIRLPVSIDTHLSTKMLVLAVIVIAIFLFIVEWVRVDVVAIMIMVALPELGLLDPSETFSGLSSNAVIAIIGVMIISFALNKVGLISEMLKPLQMLIGKSSSRMIIIFSGLIAFISSVMQNTGAAVLFLPAIRFTASRKVMVSISRVLMPIGMSAILGGTLTMIGTSPLILLNDLLPPEIRKFGLLDLTPIGLALVTGGITYFALFGKYLLKKTGKKQDNELNNNGFFDIKHPLKEYKELDGPFELYIPNNYKAGTKPNKIMTIQKEYSVNIVAVASNQEIENSAPLPDTVIKPHTSICVFGPDENVNNFAKEYGLVLLPELKKFKNYINPAITDIVEIIISPRSTFIGKTITDIGFRNTFRVNELALYQDGKVYYKQLSDMHLKAGDAILLHGTLERLHMLKKLHQNFIITSPISADPQKSVKPIPALICFVCTLFLMVFSSFYFQNRSFNPIPLSVCLMLGALGMILSGVLTINEAYRSVDWRTVFLLGGLLPLGMSVDQTGTAEWMAEGIISLIGENTPPFLLLAMLATLSAAFTLVISNVGACTLLVPLGISLSSQIGIDPRVAAIVIGIGVSNSFILPTHQVNALYMGPGGYKTLDYIKVGLPLSILYIGILVSMTYLFYL